MGRLAALNIFFSIRSVLELAEHHRVLDFGCGCGHVITHFHKLYPKTRLYGTDIDEEAVSWCQQNLSHAGQFTVNGLSPPLSFADDFFDFVFANSIFTHLPEDMELAWLAELRRVTKPGGYVLLTTHGEELFEASLKSLSKSRRSLYDILWPRRAWKQRKMQFQENGFYYGLVAPTQGLPDYYHTSFHTEDYIRAHWSKYFEISKIAKRGLAKRQDLILCRRPSQ